ncbi:HAD family hydrolase [Olivibacter sp. SDN3]|uniref:HAD family hydrolase n=1 Tax=Olivibacter sp. SDN3 TaxID=2764720 RepID=UPI0016515417|nr:HAD family hydrolase [Olivibacter sp. SDN3]QNL51655.1 HAD family hydrolase [Olivibacter sp. SDN3]
MDKIKTVIFDLDGTIANTLPLCIQAFRHSIEPLIGKSISDQEIIATFGPSEEGTISALAPDHYEQGVQNYLRNYETLHHICPTPFEGIPEILRDLKNNKVMLALVTGKGALSANISLKLFDLLHFFDVIETGSPDGPRKVEGIQTVLKHTPDTKKDQVIYIGDAPSDILACREVGIPIVAAAWAETAEPDKLRALNPDYMFFEVSDFHQWLELLNAV